jgi:hypothetical protein
MAEMEDENSRGEANREGEGGEVPLLFCRKKVKQERGVRQNERGWKGEEMG